LGGVTSVLECSALTKTYGDIRALGSVDLRVSEGELVGLLGPNGAGKSTLVKIGCGLVRASSGSATIVGEPAGSTTARASIGYLAELFRFPGWLRAGEVLELHQELTGSRGGAPERAELLELVGLTEVTGRRVETMSKGMQQRLGIAQALVGSPKLLLLDEPTSALDPGGRHAVRRILEEVRARGISVLLNSHLLSEVELVCDRVIILLGGKIIAEGTPQEMSVSRGVEIETDKGIRKFEDAVRDDIPRLIAELVAEGALIYAVKTSRPSLEEVYMEHVKGAMG
jgi:ABC-2 type transport system ATP-binding protein